MNKSKINYIIIYILLAGAFAVGLISLFSKPISAETIFANSLQTVVELKAFDVEETVSYGSAVCIDKNGTFITNAHVVSYKQMTVDKPFETLQVRFASSENYIDATLVKIDYQKDLALIKADNVKVKAAKIRKTDLKEGEKIYAVGNAQNYGISIIDGIISQRELVVKVNNKEINAVQCAINITDGNSGGALLDKNGKLIGITTFRLKDSIGNPVYGISFALSASLVSEFII